MMKNKKDNVTCMAIKVNWKFELIKTMLRKIHFYYTHITIKRYFK